MLSVDERGLEKRVAQKLDAFESRIDYRFANRELLIRALTHRSFVNEERCAQRDNQRMEFLGDAVIGLVITAALFEKYPQHTEGTLSKLKAHLVCTTTLANLATKLELGSCLMLGKGEESSGGRRKESLLADAYEAIVAAVYLDGGIDAAKRFVMSQHTEVIDQVTSPAAFQDAKSRLQEWVQEHHGQRPCYRITDVVGPPHDRTFTAEVVLGERVLGMGQGRSKKDAQRAAAAAALTQLLDAE